MVALFVSSHYKNSPNDLLLMSDAPGILIVTEVVCTLLSFLGHSIVCADSACISRPPQRTTCLCCWVRCERIRAICQRSCALYRSENNNASIIYDCASLSGRQIIYLYWVSRCVWRVALHVRPLAKVSDCHKIVIFWWHLCSCVCC
jgi:hypothetical protein